MVIDVRRFDAAEWRNACHLLVIVPRPPNSPNVETRVSNHVSLKRLGLVDRRATSGGLCAIFEHPGVGKDGLTRGAGHYGVIRMFQVYDGQDVYGYRK